VERRAQVKVLTGLPCTAAVAGSMLCMSQKAWNRWTLMVLQGASMIKLPETLRPVRQKALFLIRWRHAGNSPSAGACHILLCRLQVSVGLGMFGISCMENHKINMTKRTITIVDQSVQTRLRRMLSSNVEVPGSMRCIFPSRCSVHQVQPRR